MKVPEVVEAVRQYYSLIVLWEYSNYANPQKCYWCLTGTSRPWDAANDD